MAISLDREKFITPAEAQSIGTVDSAGELNEKNVRFFSRLHRLAGCSGYARKAGLWGRSSPGSHGRWAGRVMTPRFKGKPNLDISQPCPLCVYEIQPNKLVRLASHVIKRPKCWASRSTTASPHCAASILRLMISPTFH
jgi:hypothetical protein